MQGYCKTTGEYCPTLDLMGDALDHGMVVRAGRPKQATLDSAQERYFEKKEDLVAKAQSRCTEAKCGLDVLGAILAIRHQALEETKNELGID